MSLLRWGIAVAALGLVGCGAAEEQANDTLVVALDPYIVEPGEVGYACAYVPLDGQTLWIDAVTTELADGLHHLGVSRVPRRGDAPRGPTKCTGNQPTDARGTFPLVMGHTFTLPAGVAFEIEDGDALSIQLHVLNTSSSPLSVSAVWEAHTVDASTVTAPAGSLVFQNLDIDLPPMQRTVVTKTCAIPDDLQLFAAGGHLHDHGEEFVAEIDGAKLLDGAPKDASRHFDPPMALKKDQALKWSCVDLNTSDHTVGFGPSPTEDEMCNFFGYVFPVAGSRTFGCH